MSLSPNQFALGFSEPLPVKETPAPHDVCAGKHQGAETSVEANKIVDKGAQRKLIRRLLLRKKSLCIHDIKELTGWDANRFSGRMTEMGPKGDCLIDYTGNCNHESPGRLYRLTEAGKTLAVQEAKL